MKRISVFKIACIIILGVLTHDLYSQINGFGKIHWNREKIASGLVWKSSHTILPDSIIQNINILIINLHKRGISLSYNPEKNIIVSHQVVATGALAAVNGGFFSIKDGGSTTYIRAGELVTDADTAKKWRKNVNMTGSVLVDKKGKVSITNAKPNEWYDSHPEYTDVLVTGPLLLSEGEKKVLPETSLVLNKHPRTVIGTSGGNKIIVVTLDGRTDQAVGMTLPELSDLMISLHCKDAVNLDGGGSTTMWIAGKPFNGIVNMPCDNKKFDHEGERPVSDILIIK